MSKPIRIQRKRTKGFNLQAESMARNGLKAVSVARPAKFGNPFKVGSYVCYNSALRSYLIFDEKHATSNYQKLETKEQVLKIYREYLEKEFLDLSNLRGKNLACFCKENESCHADILLELANK